MIRFDPFHIIKTIFLFSIIFITGCASNKYSSYDDTPIFQFDPEPSIDRPQYAIKDNESYSKWSDRQPNPQKDTYIGSGVDPASPNVPVSFPWGRTGWGLRPFEYNF